jgi:DNA-binding cell septation regulator SpoVG
MEIINLRRYKGEGKTAAFFTIKTKEGFELKNFTLIYGRNGYFVSPPREKAKDGNYYDRIFTPKIMKEKIVELVLEEYSKLNEEPLINESLDEDLDTEIPF